jgi:hypothetical protein
MGLILDYEARETNGIESIKQRKHAVSQMLISIDIATAVENASRYSFIVFNTSLSCWQVMRQFMRTGRAKSFAVEIGRICAALEKCEDPDLDWRIMYLSATALCCFDSQQIKLAEEAIDKAILHADRMLTNTVTVEQNILSKVNLASRELEEASSSLRKLEEKSANQNKRQKVDCDAPEELLHNVVIGPVISEAELEAELMAKEGIKRIIASSLRRKTEVEIDLRRNNEVKSVQQTCITRLYMQRVHTNPNDSKKITAATGVTQSIRIKTLVQLQCVISGCIDGKDLGNVFTVLVKDLTAASANAEVVEISDAVIAETLLDTCRVAWQMGLRESAIESFEASLKINTTAASPVVRVKQDLCHALQSVAESGLGIAVAFYYLCGYFLLLMPYWL